MHTILAITGGLKLAAHIIHDSMYKFFLNLPNYCCDYM